MSAVAKPGLIDNDLPRVKSESVAESNNSVTGGLGRGEVSKVKSEGVASFDDEKEDCKTPTSDENKIPEILNCPPAPRKPMTRAVGSCKRKLFGEIQFVENVKREEIDAFFRSGFEASEISVKKKTKRCKCT